jgi:uncharacterized spore protein YtfJ
METRIEDLLDKLSGHIKDLASTKTILGEEFTLGDYSVRPVIKTATGFGSGGGSGDDPNKKTSGTGKGAGAALAVIPVGFLVAKDGDIQFIGSDRKTALSALLDKMPELVDKVTEMKDRKEGKEKDKKEEKDSKKKA